MPVLNDHLSVGGVLAVGGLKSNVDIGNEMNLSEGNLFPCLVDIHGCDGAVLLGAGLLE